jgi:1,2-diacylglycerol-3-alpha-glucose alpha-1,2-glucosyltransferase
MDPVRANLFRRLNMTVLLHSGHYQLIEKSGVGLAIKHQMKALALNDIPYTTDPKEPFDVIHINTVFPESYILGRKAKQQGKKVIYHAHSTEEDFRNSFLLSNQLSPLFKKWISMCYASADLIITPTPYAKELLDGYGLGKPVVAVSNGIDLDFFKRNSEDAARFRERYRLSRDDKVVVSVGLYIERKGVIDFVELAKRLPQYKFIWFGYTNLNTVPARVRAAVETKLDNLLFAGYVPPEVLKQAYCGSDLFLFPTYEETEGIVLLEALAMKLPVLVRDIPIYRKWLTDGVNVYKAGDIDGFERKVRAILENEAPSLTNAGYRVAEERDLKIIGRQLAELYLAGDEELR